MKRLRGLGRANIAAGAIAMCAAIPLASGQPALQPAKRTFPTPFSQTTDRIVVKLRAGIQPAMVTSPLNPRYKSMSAAHAAALSVAAGVPLRRRVGVVTAGFSSDRTD